MYGQATVEAQGGASVGFAPKVARWAGRVTSALVVAFLLFDGAIKAPMLGPAVEGSVRLGHPEGPVSWIGLALLVGTALHAAPRTAWIIVPGRPDGEHEVISHIHQPHPRRAS
jgi:hypothetical protein